ncbi:hypothetical protein CCH79_00002767 [Gambusia affinis]|uniref:Nuclear pore glycoprotein p62 n=1 Tax=Gambusia affinis TaxID=33528 RepID=A0A315W6B5_GAMAF|nr:hypothetical protein CCH79_00002767 [Gambusia affinis]
MSGGFNFGQTSGFFPAQKTTAAAAPTAGFNLTNSAPTATGGGFSFGAPTSQTNTNPTGSFSFGNPAKSSAPGTGFSFGTPTTTFGLGTAPQTTAAAPGLTLGSMLAPSTGTGFTLGGGLSSQTTPAAPAGGGFTFGGSSCINSCTCSYNSSSSSRRRSVWRLQLRGVQSPGDHSCSISCSICTSTNSSRRWRRVQLRHHCPPHLRTCDNPERRWRIQLWSETIVNPGSACLHPGCLCGSFRSISVCFTPHHGDSSPCSNHRVLAGDSCGINTEHRNTPLGSAATTAAASTTTAPAATTGTAVGFSLGVKPLASTAMTASTTAATLTTTAAAATTTNPPVMSYAQLENLINKWSLELEDQERHFLQQATQVNAWDRMLVENGEKITSLHKELEKVKLDQRRLNQELDFILSQQKELEDLLCPLEESVKEQGGTIYMQNADEERERTYKLAENVDAQLKRMSQDLKEIIEHLNTSSGPADTSDPLQQICKILNAHMDSLQWIDQNSVLLQRRVEEVSKLCDTQRKEQEKTFRLNFD